MTGDGFEIKFGRNYLHIQERCFPKIFGKKYFFIQGCAKVSEITSYVTVVITVRNNCANGYSLVIFSGYFHNKAFF